MKLKAFAKGVLTMAGIIGDMNPLYGLVKRHREKEEEQRKHDEEFESFIKQSEEDFAWLSEFTKNYGKEPETNQALEELIEECERRYLTNEELAKRFGYETDITIKEDGA